MATYVLPQTLVFQDLQVQPAVAANPLSAHISGGHAYLVREAESTEREFGNLGLYDDAVNVDYDWPNRPAGGVVDTTYTRLFVENALLRYLSKAAGSENGFYVNAGSRNQVYSEGFNLVSANGTVRNTSLKERDVKIGDVVRVRGVPTGDDATGDAVTLWTYVRGLIAEQVAGVVGDASTDDSNAATNSGSASVSQTGGLVNCVAASVSGSSYNGLAAGHPTETYVVRVIDGSTDADFTTARLRVICRITPPIS